MSNPITALRRQRTLFGLIAAWLFVCQLLLGGLAMARILPEQHMAALSGQSLCQPGGSGGAPAPDHDHRDCQLCPHMGAGAGLPAANAQPAIGRALPYAQTDTALRHAAVSAQKPDVRSTGPRAPPVCG